jgi:hypothetical protein
LPLCRGRHGQQYQCRKQLSETTIGLQITLPQKCLVSNRRICYANILFTYIICRTMVSIGVLRAGSLRSCGVRVRLLKGTPTSADRRSLAHSPNRTTPTLNRCCGAVGIACERPWGPFAEAKDALIGCVVVPDVMVMRDTARRAAPRANSARRMRVNAHPRLNLQFVVGDDQARRCGEEIRHFACWRVRRSPDRSWRARRN